MRQFAASVRRIFRLVRAGLARPNRQFQRQRLSPGHLAQWAQSLHHLESSRDFDIYVSRQRQNGTFGRAKIVRELSTPQRDTRTSIRNDGLEMFITSDCPGGSGLIDLWVATRETTRDVWSTPINLGPTINTEYDDGGPALTCDGTTLYFYSTRPGGSGGRDLYVTTRHRLHF
jgi:hypothetical protein